MPDKQFNKFDIPVVIKADGRLTQSNFAGSGKLLSTWIVTPANYLNIADVPQELLPQIKLIQTDRVSLGLDLFPYIGDVTPLEKGEPGKVPFGYFKEAEGHAVLPIEPDMTIYLLAGDNDGDKPTIVIAGGDTGGAAVSVQPEKIDEDKLNTSVSEGN